MRLINKLIGTAIASLCLINLCGKTVWAEDNTKLGVKICERKGQEIATNGDSPIYTTEPLDFEINTSDMGDIFYSLSLDGGESFSNIEKVTGSKLTLSPQMVADGKNSLAVKFMGIKNTDIEEDGNLSQNGVFAQSDVYKVIFDSSPTVIEINREQLSQDMDYVPVRIRKEKGYIVRIVIMARNQLLYEKRFDSDMAVKEYEVNIPYARKYLQVTGDKILISVEDEAGKYSKASFGYEDIVPKMISETKQDKGGSAEGKAHFEEEGNGDEKSGEPDVSAPVVSILGIEDGQVVNGECNIEIESIENNYEGGRVSVQLTRSALGQSSKIPIEDYELMAVCDKRSINLKRDGEYDLHVTAFDASNNTCEVHKHFVIDNTSPDIKITGIEENNVACVPLKVGVQIREMFFDDTLVNVLLSKKDANGELIQVMSQSYEMKEPSDCITLPNLTDGEYKMVVTSNDLGKNVSKVQRDFTVDTLSPIIGELSDIDGKYFDSFCLKQHNYRIRDLTKVNVTATINGNDVTENDVIIGEGKYKLRLTAVDEAGNSSEKEATFIIDHTPPQIVIEGADKKGNLKFGKMVSVSLFDNEDTLKSVSFNGRNVSIKNNKAFVKIDSIGDLCFAVKAGDEAGNEISREIRAYSHN